MRIKIVYNPLLKQELMIMGHQVTLDIPNAIYQLAQQVAKTRGTQLENVLVDMLNAYWSSDEDLFSDASKLDIVASSIESTDWWDVEGDKEWDEWTP